VARCCRVGDSILFIGKFAISFGSALVAYLYLDTDTYAMGERAVSSPVCARGEARKTFTCPMYATVASRHTVVYLHGVVDGDMSARYNMQGTPNSDKC
jgi:hypothetical protein